MIAKFLYHNPRILLLCVVVICVGGIASFLVMPRLEDPVLGRRVALVSTVFPGANAKRVESSISIPLEESLRGISQIKQIRSNSQAGISNVVIELQDEVTDVENVWTLVRDRLSAVTSDLPKSSFAPQLEVVPLKAFAAIISIQSLNQAGEGDEELAEIRQYARELRTLLVGLPGTELVKLFGDPGEEFLVELSPVSLAETGLSTAAIAQQIIGQQAGQPAGRLRENNGDLALTLQGEAGLEQISNTLISAGAGSKTRRLSDLADIRRTLVSPPASLAIVNNEPAVVLGVMVSDEIRIDHWADRMEETLDDFATTHASTVGVDLLFSQNDHVNQRMQSLLHNLALGTLAVMMVVLLLMGWRSMLVVAAALPLSAFIVLSAMRAMSIPIHQMSVTGLIVALGLLIDNAIVIVDEVRSRIVNGMQPAEAIVSGVRHLAMPLFGSTLTTALAFLPIATLPGPPGEFVGTIAVSVILAIVASFALAMTVVPALVSVLRIQPGEQGFWAYGVSFQRLELLYQNSLRLVFRIPMLGIFLGTILPIAGFTAAVNLPEQFFPASDRSQIQIEVELPARESIASTQKTVATIREIVSRSANVQRQHWFLGSSAPTFYYNVVPRRRGTPYYAQAFLDLNNTRNITDVVRSLQRQIDAEIHSGRVVVRQLEQGPPFDAPVEVRVLGEDLNILRQTGSELRRVLSETQYVIHTRSDLEETIPRLSLEVDDMAARQAGLNRAQVAGLLYTTLEGATAGTIFDRDEELQVRVRLNLDGASKMERLKALPLPVRPDIARNRPPGAARLTLGDIAEMELDSDVGAIVRIDSQRANEVKAYIRAGVLPSTVIDEFKQNLQAAQFQLPNGYSLEFGGETEQRTHAVNRLIANGFVLFALMLLTLVVSFGSFRCAFIVAAVGGLSVGLGPLALSVFGYPFGFMAIVGTMGLVGVAINDSIVVLAAIRENKAASGGDRQELVNVVTHSTRHIVATTLTTIVGFLPLIIGKGKFWPPLAITIAGGVGGATFLALYFVPSCYLLLCSSKTNAKNSANFAEQRLQMVEEQS